MDKSQHPQIVEGTEKGKNVQPSKDEKGKSIQTYGDQLKNDIQYPINAQNLWVLMPVT